MTKEDLKPLKKSHLYNLVQVPTLSNLRLDIEFQLSPLSGKERCLHVTPLLKKKNVDDCLPFDNSVLEVIINYALQLQKEIRVAPTPLLATKNDTDKKQK